MDVIGYSRVSTEDQARQGLSVGQQPERIRAYCDLHGHRLVDLITDEGVSASTPLARRMGGAALLKALKSQKAAGVVVIRLDRLFRDALDGLEFFNRFAQRHDVAVHSVSELIDSSTPHGKLSLTIQLAAAQYERDMAVQRATECNAQLRAAGKVYGGIPYGCSVQGNKQLVRDREEWARREYIVGLLERGQSLRAVRDALHAEGIPSPQGKKRWSIERLRQLRIHHQSLTGLPFAHDATDEAATPEAEVSCPT